MEFGNMFLRLLSRVILTLAMSRCHGCLRQKDLLFCSSKLPSTTLTELFCESGKTAIPAIVVTGLEFNATTQVTSAEMANMASTDSNGNGQRLGCSFQLSIMFCLSIT
ncbi:hypothetical protein RJ639_016679 [Escallonia herrerae]|uniref:Secreted protein n=1 Tax=Escallonia herrerae TaxID=1293975 RepID=A0AA89AMJ6_9ASTE|nr:hypothetical protein RJ639_016679 [Escallonia herrerae]